MRTFALAVAALACQTVLAQPAVVDAVQYPAWLERGGRAVPLTPGTVLQASDELRTGNNARVQLKLAEGSAVKLGENARFTVERIEDRGVFRAALKVVTGAFRFTTDKLRSRPREIAIRVNTVTAGIRGTDLWGKSTDARDLVCLLEGRIFVGAAGHPEVTLDTPLDFYQKPRDGTPEVSKVDAKQIEEWAKETEISTDGPAARSGGRWAVVAANFQKRDDALALSRKLRAAGYPAEVTTPRVGHNVQVGGLIGEGEARALMANLRTVPGVTIPAVMELPARAR
jgi:FecR-like protein/sporulation related protein